jgi:hypothetical protein
MTSYTSYHPQDTNGFLAIESEFRKKKDQAASVKGKETPFRVFVTTVAHVTINTSRAMRHACMPKTVHVVTARGGMPLSSIRPHSKFKSRDRVADGRRPLNPITLAQFVVGVKTHDRRHQSEREDHDAQRLESAKIYFRMGGGKRW